MLTSSTGADTRYDLAGSESRQAAAVPVAPPGPDGRGGEGVV